MDMPDTDSSIIRAFFATPQTIPEVPAPSDLFCMPMHEQFTYLQPIVQAVLEARYAPAMPAHVDFMRSSAARTKLANVKRTWGDLTETHKEALITVLRFWAFGDEDPAEVRDRNVGTMTPDDEMVREENG
jgi:hypothetical protein